MIFTNSYAETGSSLYGVTPGNQYEMQNLYGTKNLQFKICS